jgi:signal transduction histidine kinase
VNSSAPAVAKATLGALWDAVSWRATLHALLGLMVAAVLVVLVVLWGAAVVTLIEGPTGAPVLTVIYVVTAVIGPVLLLWLLGALSAVQRARFRAVLGVEIPQPPPVTGQWPLRLASAWRAAATWRQAGYHLLALIIGPAGGAAVAVCWTAILAVAIYPGSLPVGRPGLLAAAAVLLLAAPWVARGVARGDTFTARALLGPSRSEELTLRVEALARSRAEIVAATDAERRRIERDLHDGAQQLLSLAMNLGMALVTLDDVPGPARRAIEQAHEQAVEGMPDGPHGVRSRRSASGGGHVAAAQPHGGDHRCRQRRADGCGQRVQPQQALPLDLRMPERRAPASGGLRRVSAWSRCR